MLSFSLQIELIVSFNIISQISWPSIMLMQAELGRMQVNHDGSSVQPGLAFLSALHDGRFPVWNKIRSNQYAF